MGSNSLDVQPVAGALGAQIHGVDLSEPLDDVTFERIHQAMLDHCVIFFRDQDITPDEQPGKARPVPAGRPERGAGRDVYPMLLATDWAAHGLPANALKSVVPISGVFEVAPVTQTSVQDAVQMTPDFAQRNSPIFLTAQSRPPVAVTVGTSESEEFRRQSKAYADVLTEQGLPVEHFEMPGQNHFSILTESTTPGNRLTATRLKLMGLG